MKISIALATYNGQRYLKAQLDSFVAQTRLPDELVVSDDGSTDATISMIEAFQHRAPFPVVILKSEKAIGHELNFGRSIEQCSGDLIFLSDQDDVWFPDKLEVVERAFTTSTSALVVINDLEITDGDLNKTGRTVIEQTRSSGTLGQKHKSFIIGCGTAFRAQLRRLVLPIPDFKFGHDKWIHHIAHLLDARFVITRPLQLYRRHGGNSSMWAFDGPKLATWKDMVAPTKRADLRPAYQKELRVLEEIKVRLAALTQAEYQDLGSAVSRAEALRELVRAQRSIQLRIRLLGSGWAARKLLAIRMLLTGHYRYFLGPRSFIKDLIR